MAVFDQNYYEQIWGDVHRHDFAPGLAQTLVARYGRGRYLDIGTGCGFLVERLRALDCDAWGLEISEYALARCCAPGYVLQGDVRDIPFRDKYFDVVHSQGLLEYIPEADVPQVVAEMGRVGKRQHHNFDTDEQDNLPEHQKVTIKPRDWWERQLSQSVATPRVLVGCPNHVCKEYSFQQWIDNVKMFTYPSFDILVVDNSPNAELMERYGSQLPIIHAQVSSQQHSMLRITEAMAVLQRRFLAGDYQWWFNCESDVIPPVNVIEAMLGYGTGADWIAHAYPLRGGAGGTDVQQGIGCSLLSRRLMENFDFAQAGDNAPDGWLWAKVRPTRQFRTVELWGHFEVQHLAEPASN